MVAFYQFPNAHWRYLRTTNPVESPFAALRLRTSAAKRYKKVRSAEAPIWKTLMMAETGFPRLNAPELLQGGPKRKQARRWSRCQEPQPQAGRLISFTHLLT
jgi:hypothetical protein